MGYSNEDLRDIYGKLRFSSEVFRGGVMECSGHVKGVFKRGGQLLSRVCLGCV